MSKSIGLSLYQWTTLNTQLQKDYPPSVTAIREKMKDKLGFVVREHREYVPCTDRIGKTLSLTMYLDFYDEPKRTLFLLKYSEFLDNSGKNC